jgi:hypothetical protein
MMPGTFVMLPWPAESWAVGGLWLPQGAPSLGRGPAPSSWMIFGAGEMRQPCDFAQRGPGASMTVTIGRMLGLCVMVRGHKWGAAGRAEWWAWWYLEWMGKKGGQGCPFSPFTPCQNFPSPCVLI